MSELICPFCSTANPVHATHCSSCKKPLFDDKDQGQGAASGSDTDWLNNFRDAADQATPGSTDQDTAPEEQTPDSNAPSEDDEIPDWLARIRERSREESGEEGTEADQEMPTASEELPDWLADLQPPEKTSTEEGLLEESQLPDWMKPASEGDPGEETVEQTGESQAAELPDWINISVPQSEEAPASDAPRQGDHGLPDWIRTGEEADEADEDDGGLGDWMGGFHTQPLKPQEEPATSGEEGKDWLNEIGKWRDETNPAEETEPTAESEQDPDWLKSFADFEAAEEDILPEAGQPQEEAGETTDWLAQFQTYEDKALPGIEELPDSGLEAEGSLPDLPDEKEEEPTPGTFMRQEENLELPEGQEPDSSALIFDEQDMTSGEYEPLPPFSGEDLPDWFSSDKPLDETEELGGQPEEGESGLEPAQLPGWLQAMRPVEAVTPGRVGTDADQRVERSGPLAGYQGVIPGDALVTRYTKPPVYSVKLQLTEKQRIYAGLLENLLAEEKRTEAPVKEKSTAPQVILRMLVGLFIVVVMGFILFSGAQMANLPGLYAPETVGFYAQIENISSLQGENARILLAVDYEPALSGELKAASSAVLQDLLASKATLVAVSLIPAGPVLANEMVASAGQSLPEFQLQEQVINLGYLPGGASGLAALASQPAQAVPVTMDGNPAWEMPALEGITRLSDFSAVLLLSDNAENTRAWIEQVGAVLGDTPLLVISSAQIAPMVQPYVLSNQVDGLLAGLAGGASYHQLSQRSDGLARTYWDTYQIGILLVIVLILLGGLYFGSRSLFSNSKKAKKA